MPMGSTSFFLCARRSIAKPPVATGAFVLPVNDLFNHFTNEKYKPFDHALAFIIVVC